LGVADEPEARKAEWPPRLIGAKPSERMRASASEANKKTFFQR
jgi:hypothetical protein